MVLFEMLTGLPPWYTTDRQKLFDSLRNAPLTFPYHVSRTAQSIIRGMLTRDPAQRLGGKVGGESVEGAKNEERSDELTRTRALRNAMHNGHERSEEQEPNEALAVATLSTYSYSF